MVSLEKRIEIVDKYAQKLINSEYPVERTRHILVGGLKGYERLLSLSKDLKKTKWKHLHMAAGWNSRNRRTAKQRAKTNWYRGRSEVEPPTSIQEEEKNSEVSINKEGKHQGTATIRGMEQKEED